MVLLGLDQYKWSLGLERVRRALDILDHPEHSYPHVLVAGTNGKGSTCAYLERILMSTGRSVGTTMSPHVSRFTERFRINGIETNTLELKRLRKVLEPKLSELGLTYFEWCVILAAVLFERRKVDAGIFEVGLGGRYDASNALNPAVSLITEISIDHTDYLGDTITAITREKAQIARPGRPLLTSSTGEALELIREHARSIGAVLHEVQDPVILPVAQAGAPQGMNAALALKAAHILGAYPDNTGLNHALMTSFLPGRIEKVGRRIIMDVAHNPSSMLVLVEHLKNCGFDGVAVVGILADKDYLKIATTLKKVCSHLFIAPVQSPRSWGEPELRRVEDLGGITVCRSIMQAFFEALQTGCAIVITGSFYTVGEVREYLVCRGWSS
ncbi:MAG: bifunctional folylpolyglutamate synthase/dihydrofolate synthase [Desulfomonilia bacterium]